MERSAAAWTKAGGQVLDIVQYGNVSSRDSLPTYNECAKWDLKFCRITRDAVHLRGYADLQVMVDVLGELAVRTGLV